MTIPVLGSIRRAMLLAVLILSGCGGGGGGGSPTPVPVPVPPTPPAPPPPDSTPDPFAFAERTNAVRGAVATAAPIIVSGINVAADISITGGEYSIGTAAYTGSAGTVSNGDSVTVQTMASTTPGDVVEAVLTIGGVSATFRVTTSTDVTAPTASIVFPPRVSRTGSDSIIVRGTAADASGVASVSVNGVAATTTDGFANWVATVPLVPASNTLTVDVADGFLNVRSTADSVTVTRNARLGTPESIALDAANGRAFVIDPAADALIAVDLATGLRTWFADAAAPGNRRFEALGRAVVLDTSRNRLLVLDTYDESIVAVDIVTRQRLLLSGRRTSSVNRFQSPSDLALDSARNRVLVSTYASGIIAVDLDSGARTVLSDALMPGPAFGYPYALALDAAHGRVLVADSGNNAVYAVDLVNGARSILSSNTVPDAVLPFDTMLAIEVDQDGNRALVPQQFGRVLAVDLTTGARSEFSTGRDARANQLINGAADLAIDSGANRVLVLDRYVRGIAALDRGTGIASMVSSNDPAVNSIALQQVTGMVLDLENGRVLVDDEALRGIVSIDVASARGTIVIDGTVGAVQLAGAGALVLDPSVNRLYILQSGRVVAYPPAVIAVDLTTNARTLLSGPIQPDANAPLETPEEMTLDTAHSRLLVTERDPHDVKAVDVVSGARTVVSSNAIPDAMNPLITPLGVIVDAANNRALVANSTLGLDSGVLAVNLDTGARSTVFSNSGAITLTAPKLLAMDAAAGRVLVADDLKLSLFAVDLASGAIGAVTDVDDPANPIGSPVGLGYDPATRTAFLLDYQFNAVLVVDLVTGHRVYLSL